MQHSNGRIAPHAAWNLIFVSIVLSKLNSSSVRYKKIITSKIAECQTFESHFAAFCALCGLMQSSFVARNVATNVAYHHRQIARVGTRFVQSCPPFRPNRR
jgi:hypothetical protein